MGTRVCYWRHYRRLAVVRREASSVQRSRGADEDGRPACWAHGACSCCVNYCQSERARVRGAGQSVSRLRQPAVGSGFRGLGWPASSSQQQPAAASSSQQQPAAASQPASQASTWRTRRFEWAFVLLLLLLLLRPAASKSPRHARRDEDADDGERARAAAQSRERDDAVDTVIPGRYSCAAYEHARTPCTRKSRQQQETEMGERVKSPRAGTVRRPRLAGCGHGPSQPFPPPPTAHFRPEPDSSSCRSPTLTWVPGLFPSTCLLACLAWA